MKIMKNTALKLFFLFLFFSCYSVYSQCTEEKDTEMAKYMQLTKTRDPQGCSQCGMLALYFCSAKYTTTAEDKSKVSQMINACKNNIRQMGEPYCCPDYLNKQPEWGVMASTTATSNQNSTIQSETKKKMENATEMVNNLLNLNSSGLNEQKAAFSLYQNSEISANLTTKEQIEAEYLAKVKAINESAGQLKNSSDEKTKAVLQTGITGISDGSVLNGISSAANYIHSLEAEAARKKALDMLEFKKAVALERIDLEKQREQLLKKRLENDDKHLSNESSRKINEFIAYGHNLGISLQQAKELYRDFFKRALTPVMTPHGNEIKTKPKKSKEPLLGKPYAFYVKDNIIVGHKIFVDLIPFDINYKKGFEITLAKIDELQKLFGFSPVLSESKDEIGMEKSNRYTWQDGNKIVEIELVQVDIMGLQSSTVFINVYN